MDLSVLISSVPDADDLDAMSDWFSDVESWARQNNVNDVLDAAKSGLFFGNIQSRVIEFRRKALSGLKTIGKERDFVGNRVKVFIVHGHDNELKEAVARFLEKQGLDAIILHEQANGGRTIIEKLEQITADVRFAVLLYTADDEGENGQKRARQNVVFEHGYFTAKLGRQNVCVIMDENIEKPSDNQGIVYIPRADWRNDLLRELRDAGISVDANLV